MNHVRRMKYEMTIVERKRRRAPIGLVGMLDEMEITPKDREEVLKFAEFLRDSASMALPALAEKHGAQYLGLTQDDLNRIKGEMPNSANSPESSPG